MAPSRTSFLVTASLKAVARDVRLYIVIDLENCWSVLMRSVGKGHDKTHLFQRQGINHLDSSWQCQIHAIEKYLRMFVCRVLKNYCACQYCVKNVLKILIYFM